MAKTWTDGSGKANKGEPPAGFWIASDGRWYPPQPAPTPQAPPTQAHSASTPATYQQPSSMVILWEGQRETLTSMATAGKVVSARYKVTEDAIHFEAGLLSTKAETIPLWAVADVDLRQSMTQKARGLGDLRLKFDPVTGARFGQTVVELEGIRDPRMVRDLISNQANLARATMVSVLHERDIEARRASASVMNIGTQPIPVVAPAPIEPSLVASTGPSVIEQLKELAQLRDAGILTDDEFNEQKRRILAA